VTPRYELPPSPRTKKPTSTTNATAAIARAAVCTQSAASLNIAATTASRVRTEIHDAHRVARPAALTGRESDRLGTRGLSPRWTAGTIEHPARHHPRQPAEIQRHRAATRRNSRRTRRPARRRVAALAGTNGEHRGGRGREASHPHRYAGPVASPAGATDSYGRRSILACRDGSAAAGP